MKLHLPKVLRVALLGAVCVATPDALARTVVGQVTTKPGTSEKYLKLGYIADPAHSLDSYVWEGSLTIGDGNLSDGSVAQKDVDKLGGFDDDYKFVEPDGDTNKYKVDANGNPVRDAEGHLIEDSNGEYVEYRCISNLTVYKDDTRQELGDVNVLGSGQVLMGGQQGSVHMGLKANKLTVNIGSSGMYDVTRNDINQLHLISGTANLNNTPNCRGGNSYLAGSGKQSYIRESITIDGGYLQMGYHNPNALGNGKHRLIAFGSSSDFKINQNAGTMTVWGDSDMRAGSTITQQDNAKQMIFRDDLFLNGSGTTTFIQDADNATLMIGRLRGGSSYASYNIDFNQTGKGQITLAYGSSFGKDSTITLNQSGGGTIDIGGGYKDWALKSAEGDYLLGGAKPNNFTLNNFNNSMTSYEINQSDGKINLNEGASIQATRATIGGTLNVESTAVLKAKELNLSKDSNISNDGKIVAGTSETNAQTGVLNVADGGILNLADGYGTQTTGAIGTVSMTGGTLNVNGSVTLGSLSVTGGALNVLIGGANEQNGTLTFDSTAAFSMGSSSVVNLNFSEGYLESVTTESTTLSFTIATTTGTFTSGDLSAGVGMVGVDTRIWSVDGMQLTVDASGKNAIVSGTLKKSTEVNINTSDEVDSTVSDIDSQTSVKMLITEDVEISSANTHTGGTEIGTDTKGVDVVLKNDKALGAGDVTTKGESSIISDTDAEGNTVKAELTKAVENTGSLTLGGIFKGGNFGTTNLGEAHINANGEEGNNGFFREAGAGYLVVNNSTGAALTLEPGAYFETNGTLYSITTNGYACEVDYSTYHINEENHEVAMSDILAAGGGGAPAVEMENGKLTADANVDKLTATGGTLVMRNATVDGSISGDTSVEVMKGSGNILKGRNDYTGYTYVDQSVKLTVGDADALGKSSVTLQTRSSLDMNHHALENDILAGAANLYNAENYRGNLTTAAGQLFLMSDTSANKVTLTGSGGLKGCSISVNILEKAAGATGKVGDKQFSNTSTNLHINPNGTIILNDGTLLTVEGSATLGTGTRFELRGGDWQSGDVLLTTTKGINTMRAGQYASLGTVILPYGKGLYVVNGTQVTLTNIFNQNIADAMVQADWGIATASRAFVHAVRGQRTNTGCIADGRGTAWAAVLGAYNDLDGGDINLKGAAVGADMKVGSRSSVGMAIGYLDGEVSPTGLSEVDQEGTYVALYGEHGLRKLSATSCLSADWVVAYGQTESKYKGMSWDQDSLQLNGRLSWNKQLSERLGLRVFGGLEYFTSDSDTVNGIKTGSIDNLRGELGVGVDYVAWGMPVDEKLAGMGCKRLVLHGELRYFNDLDRENPVVEMDGLSGRGENPGRSGVGIDVGATYRINDRWSTSANYSYSTMDGSTEHRLNVGASYTF